MFFSKEQKTHMLFTGFFYNFYIARIVLSMQSRPANEGHTLLDTNITLWDAFVTGLPHKGRTMLETSVSSM